MQTKTKNEIEAKIAEVTEAQPQEDVRVTESLEIGKAVMQGDVLLHAVPIDHPRGKPMGTRQVAVGEGVGSHHVAQGQVEVFEGRKMPASYREPFAGAKEQQLGPVIVPAKGFTAETFTLAHPVHADHVLPLKDDCAYQVTYPVDAHTQRRVQD